MCRGENNKEEIKECNAIKIHSSFRLSTFRASNRTSIIRVSLALNFFRLGFRFSRTEQAQKDVEFEDHTDSSR